MTHNDVIQEEWATNQIRKALEGKMSPDRDGIIRVLNQKRRKEGVYAWEKCHKVPRRTL